MPTFGRVLHNAPHRRHSGTMACDPGQLRRVAQRPLPSMMMATCSPCGLFTLHCKVFARGSITLHCKVTSQKKVQARVGARPRIRPDAGSSLVTLAASRTTCSSVERYSR